MHASSFLCSSLIDNHFKATRSFMYAITNWSRSTSYTFAFTIANTIESLFAWK